MVCGQVRFFGRSWGVRVFGFSRPLVRARSLLAANPIFVSSFYFDRGLAYNLVQIAIFTHLGLVSIHIVLQMVLFLLIRMDHGLTAGRNLGLFSQSVLRVGLDRAMRLLRQDTDLVPLILLNAADRALARI